MNMLFSTRQTCLRHGALATPRFALGLLGLGSLLAQLLIAHPALAADNTPPAISPINNGLDVTLAEDDTTGPLVFTIEDAETLANELTVSASSDNEALIPPAGIVLAGSDSTRSITLTPAANQFGSAVISVTVSDGLDKTTQPFTVVVSPVNDPPTLSAIAAQSTLEDKPTQPIAFTVQDIDSQPLAVTASSGNGSLVPDGNISFAGSGSLRTITLTPAANQFGTTPITITVTDGFASAQTSFVLTVQPVNDAPTLSPIANQTTPEDTPLGPLNFSVNDIDSGSSANLTVSAVSANQNRVPNANITITPATGGSGTRTLSITPAANASGAAQITLSVSDGSLTDTATFTLNITPVNDPPTISPIANQTTNEDQAIGPIAFTVSDPDSSPLSLGAVSGNAALVPAGAINFGGSGAARTVTLTPAANQFGTASITITVSDGPATASSVFLLTVNPVNDAPTLSPIANQTTPEDTPLGPLNFSVNDVDGSNLTNLTVSAVSANQNRVPNANITITPATGGSGTRALSITPAANASGGVQIAVSVSDGSLTDTTTFNLNITPANDPPTISAIANQTTNEDQAIGPIAFTVGDLDSGPLSLVAVSGNAALVPNGSISFGGSGTTRTVTLTPAANQFGTTPITLTVSDGPATASSVFLLTVNPVNDAPTLSAIANQTTPEDTPLGPLSFSVNDVDGPNLTSLTVTAISSNEDRVPSANITITPATGGSGTRALSIVPAANASGAVRIALTVSDGSLTDTTVFTLTIAPVNDPPTLSPIPPQRIAEGVPSSAIPFGVGDVETDPAALVVTATSSNPSLIGPAGLTLSGSGAARTLTLTPMPFQNGQAIITLTVRDNGNLTTSQSFVVTVGGVDDPPTLSAIDNQTILEDGVLGPVTLVISDVDTPLSTLLRNLTATTANTLLVGPGGISFAGTGGAQSLTQSLWITPLANANGVAQIDVRIKDDTSTVTRSFTLNVVAVNDAPKIDPILEQVTSEDTPLVTTFRVTDPDSGNLSVSATSSNPDLVSNAGIAINPASGASTERQLTVVPLPNASGITFITLTVSDGALVNSTVFQLKVNPVDDAPTLSPLGAQTIAEDGTTGPLAFTVDDIDTPPANLQVTASSSNPALVPLSQIALSGSGTNRAIVLTPLPNTNGSSQIILTVSDGTSSASTTFALLVSPVNDPPVISAIGSQEVLLGGSAVFTFTVTDIDDPYSDLQVVGESSNPAVVPATGAQFQFSPITPPNRLTGPTTRLTLVPNATIGSARITLRVSDGEVEAISSFNVFVVNETNPPSIAPITDQTVNENAVFGPLQITVTDDRVPSGELQVSVSSSNPALVPNDATHLALTHLGGMTRGLVITPTANQVGETIITVLVSDGPNTASTSFKLTVRPVDGPPSIALVDTPPLTGALYAGTPSAPVLFRVADQDTDVAQLVVTASSSDARVLPASGIVLAGTGADRTVRLTPAPGQAGSVQITLQVSDGTSTATTSFTVNVFARLNLPILINRFAQCAPAQTDCSEPNNSLQTAAGPLRVNTPYTGTVNTATDRFDFYAVTLEAGARYTVSLTFAGNDLDLFLYGPAPLYPQLVSSNFQGIARPEQVVYQPQTTGVYYLLAYGFDTASQPRPYTLFIQSQPARE